MNYRIVRQHSLLLFVAAMAVWLFGSPTYMYAQRGGQAQAPQPAREQAAFDPTGYWVSLITEDWRWRMLTAEKGSYPAIPLNAEGRRVADQWDPASDAAEGNACKAYGAGNIMRMPTRLHVTWEDDDTLRIDTDAGMQTRLFHFDGSPPIDAERTWQGYSAAQWEVAGGQNGIPRGGNLKVVTTGMRAGYLQRNGVPYSEDAVVTEYFHRAEIPGGDTWLIVSTLVDDPRYLESQPGGGLPDSDRVGPLIRSSNFKREPDGSKWNPTPCEVK